MPTSMQSCEREEGLNVVDRFASQEGKKKKNNLYDDVNSRIVMRY